MSALASTTIGVVEIHPTHVLTRDPRAGTAVRHDLPTAEMPLGALAEAIAVITVRRFGRGRLYAARPSGDVTVLEARAPRPRPTTIATVVQEYLEERERAR